MAAMPDVTRILSQIEQGDPQAAEMLLPLVYDELRKLAAAKLAQEKPGQTLQARALVLVNDDLLFEEYETLLVNLSTPNSYAEIINAVAVGTIIDDEPRISVSDAYFYEGDVSPFTFTVSLSAASTDPVTVDFTTADGTALAGVDYAFAAGTLTFAPGV